MSYSAEGRTSDPTPLLRVGQEVSSPFRFGAETLKQKLYQHLMKRMDQAVEHGRDVEAGWYAYAVLEDRLRSMLRQSGGEGQKKGYCLMVAAG